MIQMVMSDFYPKIISDCLKGLLGLNRLVRGKPFLYKDITDITVVKNGYCCCVVAPIGWSALDLGGKLGVDYSSWSTDTQLPRDVIRRILTQFLGHLVLNGRLFVAPYRHPAHLGGCTIIMHSGGTMNGYYQVITLFSP